VNDLIDIVELVKTDLSRRPRGRVCFVLTRDASGQSGWAGKLAQLTGAQHLDVLEHFREHEELATKVSSFGVDDLLTLFGTVGSEASVLIVSGFEFLRSAWSGQPSAVEKLASKAEFWNRRPALLLVTQCEPFLGGLVYQRFPHLRASIEQKNTISLD
jgi:hypothetical protein